MLMGRWKACMVIDALLVLVGLLLLVSGGEALVRGASGIALIARITPSVVGLTVVAAGTSMPELVVSTRSAWAGSPGLAMGNVVGSNIFNIGAIVGLTAIVRPLRIEGNTVRAEWPVMMLSAVVLHLLARDGQVDRLEGGFLVLGLGAFVAYVVSVGRTDPSATPEVTEIPTASLGRTGAAAVTLNGVAVALGIGLLASGASVLVKGAIGIASSLGVSEAVIGLTVVAAGTSLPELMTSLIAARRGQDDIAIGNVVGSNIFNVLGILGTTAVILPVAVPREILERDDWWMMGASLLLFPLMKSQMTVTRSEGALLLAGMLSYLVVLLRAVGVV
jgi:cation:H+ antiporter